jgi:hypothetical protein
MPAQPIHRRIKHIILFGKTKAHRVGGAILAVKGTYRHSRNPNLGGQVSAKSNIIAVKI